MKSHQFTTLDGLRGVAAAAVVTRHATDYFSWGSQYIPSLKPGAPPVPVGPLFESYLAVDFFFVLSGFVLAHAYWRRLCSGMSAVEFICLRLIRLYPLYLIALVFAIAAACIEVVAGGRSVTSLVKNIIPAVLFLPAPALTVFGTLFPLNMPTWSLFFELVANSGFGVIGKRIKPVVLAVFVCSVALILISAVMTKTCGFGAKAGGALDYGTNWRSIGAGFLRDFHSQPAFWSIGSGSSDARNGAYLQPFCLWHLPSSLHQRLSWKRGSRLISLQSSSSFRCWSCLVL